MPTYRFLGQLITLMIRRQLFSKLMDPESRARREIEHTGMRSLPGRDVEPLELADFLSRHNRQYQFAPSWSTSEICPERLHVLRSQNGAEIACAGIWDQRAIKQTVVRGYSGALRWTKPFLNFAATLFGAPRLPRVGAPLSHAYISHLATVAHHPEIAASLVLWLLASRQARSADYLTLAFDSRDPRLPLFRRTFRAREYTSRMYAVYWDDGAELADKLDGRLLAPEVATL
jgi:hypothetical protein